jgi:hypothetical protein
LSALTWAKVIHPTAVRSSSECAVSYGPHRDVKMCFAAEITNPLRIPNPDHDPTFEDEVRAIYRCIGSASMFVEQQPAAESGTVRVGKHVAQQADHLHVSPTCSVVHMRRLDHRRHGDAAEHETAAEWQCQWLVRGHWRQPFYPSVNRYVPRWIARTSKDHSTSR